MAWFVWELGAWPSSAAAGAHAGAEAAAASCLRRLHARAPCWRRGATSTNGKSARGCVDSLLLSCSPPGLFCKLRQEGAHSAPRTYRRDRMSSPPSPSPSPPSPSPLPSPPPPSQSPGGGNMMPGVATAGGSASYDPEAAYEDKDSYSPELDSLPPLAKHIQRHHTPVSPPPPKHKHILPPHTPPPSPPHIAISLAPDSDYLNALSAAVLAAVAVVLLGYVCYQRRRSQSFALHARTRLSDEDSASTSAAVQLELPTASRRHEEVSDM